ncbi:hypothetical protein F5887DRAFT_937051 [Amanita rubescens]|nr:hypothetical protein F5887DRAFT_937051 [Amanita rubescens]
MDLPSARELELEALVRQRDAQLANLTDEVSVLRQFLSSQPAPLTSDPLTLPPSLVSLLLPHIASSSGAAPRSGTVTAALTQRAQLLQEENDELYEILKNGETGHLKEEARGLRRVVDRLEKALRQSHQVIETLSAELEKSYTTLLTSARQSNSTSSAKANSRSPRNSYHPSHRPVQAHKKPRLSEPRVSSPPRSSASHQSQPTAREREYTPRQHSEYRVKGQHGKMDVDDEQRRAPTPAHDRDRERERERGPKDRDRDRDRDGRYSRRNGNFGGGRGGSSGGRRADRSAPPANFTGDRTLAERLGL